MAMEQYLLYPTTGGVPVCEAPFGGTDHLFLYQLGPALSILLAQVHIDWQRWVGPRKDLGSRDTTPFPGPSSLPHHHSSPPYCHLCNVWVVSICCPAMSWWGERFAGGSSTGKALLGHPFQWGKDRCSAVL